jgi:hypothetical protein
MKPELVRLLLGVVLLAVVLVGTFAFLMPRMTSWGATPEETRRTMAGDELQTKPLINWTNATTINAPVEQVWPWIAQLGDRRGGFYSYTWIEKLISGIPYRNADRILPEFQDPRPGQSIIEGQLAIAEVETGHSLFAKNVTEGMGWTWTWQLDPLGENQTRLVNRIRISVPKQMETPVVTFVMGVGAFVMEQNMMQGTKIRAEGGTELSFTEPLEIALWVAALAAGIAAAWLFAFRGGGILPLGLGVGSVVWLVVLTMVQPALGLRALVDLALIGGVVLAARG